MITATLTVMAIVVAVLVWLMFSWRVAVVWLLSVVMMSAVMAGMLVGALSLLAKMADTDSVTRFM